MLQPQSHKKLHWDGERKEIKFQNIWTRRLTITTNAAFITSDQAHLINQIYDILTVRSFYLVEDTRGSCDLLLNIEHNIIEAINFLQFIDVHIGLRNSSLSNMYRAWTASRALQGFCIIHLQASALRWQFEINLCIEFSASSMGRRKGGWTIVRQKIIAGNFESCSYAWDFFTSFYLLCNITKCFSSFQLHKLFSSFVLSQQTIVSMLHLMIEDAH